MNDKMAHVLLRNWTSGLKDDFYAALSKWMWVNLLDVLRQGWSLFCSHPTKQGQFGILVFLNCACRWQEHFDSKLWVKGHASFPKCRSSLQDYRCKDSQNNTTQPSCCKWKSTMCSFSFNLLSLHFPNRRPSQTSTALQTLANSHQRLNISQQETLLAYQAEDNTTSL